MSSLALFGGKKIRERSFPAHNAIGQQEIDAVARVMRSGVLSRYLGAAHDNFMGGPEVRSFERVFAQFVGAKHCVAVNSATSGLICAAAAVGLGPGDEVIVPAITMAASATAVLISNAVPVFVDIEPEYYCIDPEEVRKAITKRTKAIVVVHWLGQAANMPEILKIAAEFDLAVIEDAAQAPMASVNGRRIGLFGDAAVFSLNYHKHIHTGEGGLVVTNDDEIFHRLTLVRNHGEAAEAGLDSSQWRGLLGYNFRLGEIEAAIGLRQLEKLPELLGKRLRNVAFIEDRLSDFSSDKGLSMPLVRPNSVHNYYTHAIKLDQQSLGVSLHKFVEAIKAELPVTKLRENEGVLIGFGGAKPLYKLPIYQSGRAFNRGACSLTCPRYGGQTDYQRVCTTSEQVSSSLLVHELMHPFMTEPDLLDFVEAVKKVFNNRTDLS